ncbi:hypothetical protein AC249_AIPGENE13210 [Exaiptasia diaphana]|nr:hypothetical protein AC249_AIPGENE13210 [Exaiptasia diaphana]
MKALNLILILLAVFAFGGECKPVGNKKGDHLFNNIAKAFTKMIQDIFEETSISKFCTARPGVQFIVEDTTDKNKDVTKQFPFMDSAFREYKDKTLTTDRDSLTVYGRANEGADANSLRWSESIAELRRRVFALITKFVDIKIQGKPSPRETLALQNHLRELIEQILNRREFVDQDAKRVFIQDPKNKAMLGLVDQVEQRSANVLRELPGEANKWAVEAANFVQKKFSGKK